MINIFENDRANVSVNWLIEEVTKRGLIVRHLLRVKHTATGALHYIVVLPDGRYLCNYVQGLPFHISLIRPRQVLVLWYQDPAFEVESVPAVYRTHQLQAEEFKFPTSTIRSVFASKPIDTTSHSSTPPPWTQTVPAREVFHNVQAAIRPLLADVLVQSLQDLQ
ncbi:hypothetical protein C8J57DRAFT_1429887 [Mycena rebaudengoi]|nr:hypothetical protein C8J57DRAFT_1429887 [Mycena rebaudengoi]